MNRRHLLLFPAGVLLPTAVQAAPSHETETSGTVLGLDQESQLLTILTRLGRKQFGVTTSTLYLLNNHTTTQAGVQFRDEVTVTHLYPSMEAVIVHLTREVKTQVRVTATGTTSIEGRLSANALISFRTDSQSRIDLEGIVLSNRAVLVGRGATVIYEPGTNPLILSISGKSKLFRGSITAIDTAARTVTVRARQTKAIVLDANATIRRNGEIVAIDALVVNDRVSVAYTKDGAVLDGLALQARS